MTPDGPKPKTTDDVFKGRKVVLVAVPGAFTPTCHRNHLPGYVAEARRDQGEGRRRHRGDGGQRRLRHGRTGQAERLGGDKIEFLSDGNGDFAKALGLTMDGSGFGLGTRSQRYSMVVEDGVVRSLNVEDAPGKADVSGADNLLKSL